MRIEVDGLAKRYGAVRALDNASLAIDTGELLAVLGPSGSGKTTLLRSLAGFVRPDAGTVRIDGRDATRDEPRARRVGVVFQNYALFPHLDVAANIAFGLRVPACAERARFRIANRIAELLAVVQLPGYEKRYPRELSGGEKQRIAFARALAIDPLVLALDEPFAALDAAVRATLRTWLRDAPARATAATLLITHDAHEAMAVADRVAILGSGRVEAVGTPAALYAEPPSLAVMRALGTAEAFDGGFVRPHDVRVRDADDDGARAAVVVRTVPLGGRTRVELVLDDGSHVTAERADAEFAALRAGSRVGVRAARVHRFA